MSGRPGESENVDTRGTENLSGLELAARQLFAIRSSVDATLSFIMREIKLEQMAGQSAAPAPDRSGDDTNAADVATERILNRSDIPGARSMPPTFRGPKESAAPDPATDPLPTVEATQ